MIYKYHRFLKVFSTYSLLAPGISAGLDVSLDLHELSSVCGPRIPLPSRILADPEQMAFLIFLIGV